MPELPIACTLTPDGMTARLALIDALAADGLLDRTPTDTGCACACATRPRSSSAPASSSPPSPQCCAFLDFDLAPRGRRPGARHRRPRGRPAGHRPVLRARGGLSAVSALRWTLVALLVASTALFAVGVIAERSDTRHARRTRGAHEAKPANPRAHRRGEARRRRAHEPRAAPPARHSRRERGGAGRDLESTPLIVLAVLAASASLRWPRRGSVACPVSCLRRARSRSSGPPRRARGRPSTRRVPHRHRVVAITVAVLHLAAAAVSGHLARMSGDAIDPSRSI